MNINELYLNVHDTSLSSAICQTAIQTEEDKLRCRAKGYAVNLTEAEFRKEFPGFKPAHIHYSLSIGLTCFYFNRETLAICPFHLTLLSPTMPDNDRKRFVDGTLRTIEAAERGAAEGCYTSAITTLPDRMRLEFFTLLVKKHGTSAPDLYKQFFDAYLLSDYGFRDMDKDTLNAILQNKTAEDRKRTAEVIKDLPKFITVYREGNSKSVPYQEAYSWSLDINVANFFAARRGNGPGYIAKAHVLKDDIIEAFLGDNSRGEEEIIVDPRNVSVIEVIHLHGTELLETVLPKVAPMYRTYREKIRKLHFLQKSDDHGEMHEARVLLLTQIMAEMAGLPEIDRKLLATAAIYHDTQRTHDGDDESHGEAAARYYFRNEMVHHPIVEFLCEYHCLPDGDGLEKIRRDEILQKHGNQRVTKLWQIFKDADALDRVRFDIRCLDWNQLRTTAAQELTLVARMCYQQIKL